MALIGHPETDEVSCSLGHVDHQDAHHQSEGMNKTKSSCQTKIVSFCKGVKFELENGSWVVGFETGAETWPFHLFDCLRSSAS